MSTIEHAEEGSRAKRQPGFEKFGIRTTLSPSSSHSVSTTFRISTCWIQGNRVCSIIAHCLKVPNHIKSFENPLSPPSRPPAAFWPPPTPTMTTPLAMPPPLLYSYRRLGHVAAVVPPRKFIWLARKIGGCRGHKHLGKTTYFPAWN